MDTVGRARSSTFSKSRIEIMGGITCAPAPGQAPVHLCHTTPCRVVLSQDSPTTPCQEWHYVLQNDASGSITIMHASILHGVL